jgi:hypothetical protein
MTTLVPCFLFGIVANAERKVASDAKYNCAIVLKDKKIKICTDLMPAKNCKNSPSSLVKKGTAWTDEFQISAAEEMWTTNPDNCIDYLTEPATKTGCCGG